MGVIRTNNFIISLKFVGRMETSAVLTFSVWDVGHSHALSNRQTKINTR